MANDSFDNWINGFPVIIRDANTRGFDFWLNGFPLIDELVAAQSGAANFTFADMTVTGSGTVANPVTGTGSFTFADMTTTSSGSVVNPVTGTATITFADMTVTSSGTVIAAVTGTGSVTFDAMTLTGVATFAFAASGSVTFDPMTVSGAGSFYVQGVGSFTFADMTASGSASYTPVTSGAGSFTFDDMTAFGEANIVEDRTATGNITLDAMTVTGSGTVVVPLTGRAEFFFADMTMSGAGEVENPAGIVDWPLSLPAPLIGRKHRNIPENSSTLMESGRLRMRRQYITRREMLEVQWSFTDDEFDEFKQLFEGPLLNGQNAFSLATYEIEDDAHFVTPIFYLFAFMGQNAPYSWVGSDNGFLVSATLEVVEKIEEAVQESPGNPVPPDDKTPTLEYDFTDFPCQEMFHLKTTGMTPLKAHTIQIAEAHDGPWRPHVYFVSLATGQLDYVFNNDYQGNHWFRVVRDSDGKVAAKPTHPPKSLVTPPIVEISNTVPALAELYGDLAYNQNSPTNPRINQGRSYFIVPRGRVRSTSGQSLNPDPDPRVVTISGDPGTTATWTRDNTDPEDTSGHPDYDGVPNNIAVQRADFRYAIRARSFVPAGCKSPITLILVDKEIWQRPYTRARGGVADEVDTCDMPYTTGIREDWSRNDDGTFKAGLVLHKFESSDSCDFYAPTFKSKIIEDCRGGNPGLSETLIFFRETTFTVENNRISMGHGDNGDLYTGFDQELVTCVTFHAEKITLERNALYWDLFPKCYTNSRLITDTGTYIVSTGESDSEVITGASGTKEFIEVSWGSDSVAVASLPGAHPIDHVDKAVKPLLDSDSDGSLGYDAYIVLTLHNDIRPPSPLHDVPPYPVIPPPPPYVAPTDVDPFEEYPTTSNAELIFYMNAGTGWFATSHWTIQTIDLFYGFETFETYVIDPTHPSIDEPPLSSGLNDGDGFTGAWVIETAPAVIGLDTFQGYQRQILHVVLFANFDVSGTLGSGGGDFGYAGIFWDGFWTIRESSKIYGLDKFENQLLGTVSDVFFLFNLGFNWGISWTIEDTLGQLGGEDWEGYFSLTILGDESNQAGLGIRWAEGTYWKFRSAKAYGLDDFELYATGNFTTGQSGINWDPHSAWLVETI